MNDTLLSPEATPDAAPRSPALLRGLRHILACNPFYPISAVVLLFGAYQISAERAFQGHDLARLGFNFGSLQLYEALLVVTAVFLARRMLWYDSLLLVTLENLLVLVPFIFISEAALLENWVVGVLCGAGAALALGRFGVLRRWMPQLNLPRVVLSAGAVILALNLVLPILFRHFHETKVGTRVTDGSAYDLFQATWLMLLPLMAALAWFVPLDKAGGKTGPRNRWFAPAFFGFWLTGTAMHCWSLGYVYDFEVQLRHLAPLVWTLGWLGCARLVEVWPARPAKVASLALLVPLLATFLSAEAAGLMTFRVLTLANTLAFALLIFLRREGRAPWHLAALSLIALVATLPSNWVIWPAPAMLRGVERPEFVVAMVGFYTLLCIAISRNAKLAVLGAIIVFVELGGFLSDEPAGVHLAAQAGVIFFLLHSLRWDDSRVSDARVARGLALVAWVTHAWVWTAVTGLDSGWMSASFALVALVIYRIHIHYGGRKLPWFLAAGVSIMLSGPVCAMVSELQSAPTGVLATLASFGLFALGTLLALTRHHWHVPASRKI